MIAYSDLVAALRHWRERNGLPNFGTDPGPAPAVVLKAPPGPPGPPPGAPRTSPPVAPGGSIEVDDEIEAHEIESEEIYENEGSDFALNFAGAPPRPSEPTVQGVPPGYGTDPNAESKFPGITAFTEPGMTDPETFGVTATLDDDFVSESSPAPMPREGTKPGIGSVLDADTDDQTLPPAPPGKKKKKR
jgi:hypothetical protein